VSDRAVIDASVALKWLLDDEDNVAQAVAIRDADLLHGTMRLIAPMLAIYEVANGLVMATRRGRMRASQAREALTDFLDVGLEMAEAQPTRILELADEYTLTAYDATYLAVAESEGCELWTADAAVYQSTRDELPWVRWVAEYAP
jgi:predicted nucleic acid-binding protein